MEEDCIFCKIVKGDISAERVLDNDDFIVIRDANPKVDGHSLVISKKHYDTFFDMPQELYSGMLEIAREFVEKSGIDNFNLVVNNGKFAGQLVPHVHLHILPRRGDDGFSLNV